MMDAQVAVDAMCDGVEKMIMQDSKQQARGM